MCLFGLALQAWRVVWFFVRICSSVFVWLRAATGLQTAYALWSLQQQVRLTFQYMAFDFI
jgi:hypothetical protein